MNLWGKILVGCVPAAIVGVLFDDVFEALFYNPTCIAIALIVSGTTIIGGLLIGLSRPNAAEFTFYLAIPTMFGASLLKLVKFGLAFTGIEIAVLLVGMLVSFVVSVVVIKFLMSYIKKHNFKVFGYYRIILGIAVLAYFFLIK